MKEFPDKDWKDINNIDDLPRKPFAWYKPPWARFGRPYHGRIEWWADYRYKDPVLRSGRWRLLDKVISEETDPAYIDPPLPDGESQIAFEGVDQPYVADKYGANARGEIGAAREQWYGYILRNSTQFKDIAARYNISAEHPGMVVQPEISSAYDWWRVYRPEATFKHWYNVYLHYQPRFSEHPINEGTLTKAAFGAKYGALTALVYAWHMSVVWDNHLGLNARDLAKRFKQISPYFIPMPAVFFSSVSLAAQYRDIDDMYNWCIAAFAAAVTQGTMLKNMRVVLPITALLSFGGCVYHITKTSQYGFNGPNRLESAYYGGPLAYLNPGVPYPAESELEMPTVNDPLSANPLI